MSGGDGAARRAAHRLGTPAQRQHGEHGDQQRQRESVVQVRRRPAAVDQLEQLGKQISMPVYALDRSDPIAAARLGLEAARKASPQDVALTAGLSDLLARNGDAKKALDVLDGAKVNGQLPIPLQLALARAQFASGAPEDAKNTYRGVLLV